MKKIGLVLAGGGGKGAYQIGVWKALREFGIEEHVSAVAGTSVGALNTALFIQGNLEKAEDVWVHISPEKILTVDPLKLLFNARNRLPQKLFSVLEPAVTRLIGHGWFSRDGLLEIIQQDVDLSAVEKSPIIAFATCLHAKHFEAEYFKLNGSTHKRIESILLASSALPFIFDPVEIDGDIYWDGGVPLKKGDNLPIRPLYEKGCDLIIAVHLSRSYLIDHQQFPNAQIIEIVPQENQGGFFDGTLDFTSSGSKRRMQQGYRDAKKVLQPIVNMMLLQGKIQMKLNELKQDEVAFHQQRETILDKRNQLKEEIDQYLKR